ncbi:SDR family oxidoreductase [Sorangium sp. So ce341]|uniref:SDR family oxidoreductase n=1 Tax=Sorangium sp. So ce341 TaxID=3133302 RepID=UPI003F5DF085
MSLQGKFALVTGSSRGIGRGIALALAARGASVGVHYYRNEAAALEVLKLIREKGSNGFVVQADVSEEQDILRMFERVKGEFAALDVFVSNARPEIPEFYQPPLEITLDAWRKAVDSQATAFLLGAREASRMMSPGGRIVAITYAGGGRFGSWQPWVAMGSAKAAMESLCRYFAVTLARRAITVNAVSPGWTTDSVLNTLPDAVQTAIQEWSESGWCPMGRMGTPEDIGNVVSLLCTKEAGWITGQTIMADGGASLMDAVMPLEIQQPRG